MKSSYPNYKIPSKPIPKPESVVEINQVRFCVLTPRLIRMEYNPLGGFEDLPSQTFWYRNQTVPELKLTASPGETFIETDALRLHYKHGLNGFNAENLAIHIKANGCTWHYGDIDHNNLLGTARTLDEADGAIKLQTGLLSRSGWTLVDDSGTLVFNPSGWLEPRNAPDEALDLYFFAYGSEYQACLDDYLSISGQVPLLPRWILGNWWSRYWAYTQQELTDLMFEFKARQVPLSVCIIDMDWHLTETGNQSSGWTGYTWNRELFPDPQGFIEFLHRQGLRTSLNLHPAAGIHPHEVSYTQFAEWMGIDPQSQQAIPFDITDPHFAQGYFEILHHPYEAMGVDFWWIDWQQGGISRLSGLDPLWWLNHLHFYDQERQPSKRPLIFSRWGGLGNQRYPLGFSGDSVVSWESLAFQPYFTATASNVAYSWWSHDIGGHMGGIEDRELYTRWVQFGVFSPILRLHSTNNPFHERLPWGFDAEVFHLTRTALQLRHQLVPYIYTMAWQNYNNNKALVRPLYHAFPDEDQAYYCPQEYLFGSELLVAPFTSPIEPSLGLSRQVVWLPQGSWRNFFSGEYYPGGAWYTLYGTLEEIPVFAREGAIIPLASTNTANGVPNPQQLDLHVFVGADNRFSLYEDDGVSNAYQENKSAITVFEQTWQDDKLTFSIHPAHGNLDQIPNTRSYRLFLHGIVEPQDLQLTINGHTIPGIKSYNSDTETLIFEPVSLEKTDTLTLICVNPDGLLLSRRYRKKEKFFKLLKHFRLNSTIKALLFERYDQLLDDPGILSEFDIYLDEAHKIAMLEMLFEVGAYHIHYTQQEFVILWNNHKKTGFGFNFRIWVEGRWLKQTRTIGTNGEVNRFTAIVPAELAASIPDKPEILGSTKWSLHLTYFNQAERKINNFTNEKAAAQTLQA